MNQESKLLIHALGRAVAGKDTKPDTQVDWEAFLALARRHKVEGLVYAGLEGCELPDGVRAQLSGAYHRAIFADTQLEYRKAQLHRALTDRQVPHVFLKGAVLKYDYPIPALRTMTDLDILVYTRDYDQIDAVGAALGGTLHTGDGNHRNFKFPGGVVVEFHPNILHHSAPVGVGVNPGWQYVREGEMTEEGLFLSVLCHLADHFVAGGIGVRFVLDMWVLNNLRSKPVDRAFVDGELQRFGLLEFTNNVEALAQCWFGEREMTPLLEELGEYILSSGSHGFMDRAMLNAVAMSQGGSRASALWHKVFYPRAELEDRYRWCKGKPWLLPAAWCARAFRAVTKHGSHVLRWTKETGKYSDRELAQQKALLARFGIRREKS